MTMQGDGTRTVWASVVTRNRIEMLKDCIESLRAQTRKPDKILVVDNESDDGTAEWVSKQSDLLVVRQSNKGSAGGQYTALKTAYEGGAGWTWTMDDDVLPRPDALEKLLAAWEVARTPFLLASKVVGPGGESMNTPGIDMSAPANGYCTWDELLEHGMVRIEESTFVSILVSREALQKAGYPIAELFIWGDDTEFSRRCAKSGPCYMAGKSMVVHRRETSEALNVWKTVDKGRMRMFRYLYRNQAFIAKTLGQHVHRRNSRIRIGPAVYCALLAMVTFRDVIAYRRIAPLPVILRGTIEGLRSRFEPEYPVTH